MVAIEHIVILSLAIAAIGAWGLLRARDALRLLISVELIINAANLDFVAFAVMHGDTGGLIFVLFSIALAAAEAAVGLAIFIQLFRRVGNVSLASATSLRW